MPVVLVIDEWLRINGSLYIGTPAVIPIPPGFSDIEALAPLRGSNDVVSHAPGSLPTLLDFDELVAHIPIQIKGYTDDEGTPYSDPRQGLKDNWNALKAGIGAGSHIDDGTVEVLWHNYDGSEFTAQAQTALIGYERDSDRVAHSVLRLTFPYVTSDGLVFTETGS